MSYDDARRELERSTDFAVTGGQVWLREVRWLRAVDDLGTAEILAAPVRPWALSPASVGGRAA